MAASPQIIKSYATEDYSRAMSLVIRTSKMSFLLIFILAFPLICNITPILQLWLSDNSYTPDMEPFSKLLLLYCMLMSLEPPISRIIQATGNLKTYQLRVGVITLLYIPITALALSAGGGPMLTIVILLVVTAISQFVRITVAHSQVNLSYSRYFKEVVFPIVKVSAVAVAVYFLFATRPANEGIVHTLLSLGVTTIIGIFIAAVIGLDRNDRLTITQFVKALYAKKHK